MRRGENRAGAGAIATGQLVGGLAQRNRAVLSFIHKSTASIYSSDGQIAIVARSRARSRGVVSLNGETIGWKLNAA